jgi:hypothetical protein
MGTNGLLSLAAIVMFFASSTIQSDAGDAWGAFTVCCLNGIHGSACGGGGVSTGFGSGPTQDAAKAGSYQQAISDVNSSLAWKCTTARTFNRGCSYIAEGCNENHCGWAIGASATDAVKKLEAMDYPKHDADARGGGCVGR